MEISLTGKVKYVSQALSPTGPQRVFRTGMRSERGDAYHSTQARPEFLKFARKARSWRASVHQTISDRYPGLDQNTREFLLDSRRELLFARVPQADKNDLYSRIHDVLKNGQPLGVYKNTWHAMKMKKFIRETPGIRGLDVYPGAQRLFAPLNGEPVKNPDPVLQEQLQSLLAAEPDSHLAEVVYEVKIDVRQLPSRLVHLFVNYNLMMLSLEKVMDHRIKLCASTESKRADNIPDEIYLRFYSPSQFEHLMRLLDPKRNLTFKHGVGEFGEEQMSEWEKDDSYGIAYPLDDLPWYDSPLLTEVTDLYFKKHDDYHAAQRIRLSLEQKSICEKFELILDRLPPQYQNLCFIQLMKKHLFDKENFFSLTSEQNLQTLWFDAELYFILASSARYHLGEPMTLKELQLEQQVASYKMRNDGQENYISDLLTDTVYYSGNKTFVDFIAFIDDFLDTCRRLSHLPEINFIRNSAIQLRHRTLCLKLYYEAWANRSRGQAYVNDMVMALFFGRYKD